MGFNFQRLHIRECLTLVIFLSVVLPVNSLEFEHCHLPQSWTGSWHHVMKAETNSYFKILINGNSIEGKGKCKFMSTTPNGEQNYFYVFEQKDDFNKDNPNATCHVCRIFSQPHPFVLQYKEQSSCDFERRISLSDLCNFPTDSQQQSFYRLEDTHFNDCPIEPGEYSFSYTRERENKILPCNNPANEAFVCYEANRYFFKYEGCHDVESSERDWSTVECLADWKDGYQNYFVAVVKDKTTKEHGSFRCFNYEKESRQNESSPTRYKIAKGLESCSDLASSSEGQENLNLTKRERKENCKFPNWLEGTWRLQTNNSLGLRLYENGEILDEIEMADLVADDFENHYRYPITCQKINDSVKTNVSITGIHLSGCNRCIVEDIYTMITDFVIQSKRLSKTECTYSAFDHEENEDNGQDDTKIYIRQEELDLRVKCPFHPGNYSVDSMIKACDGGMILETEGEYSFRIRCKDSGYINQSFACRSSWKHLETTYFLALEGNDLWCFKVNETGDDVHIEFSKANCPHIFNPGQMSSSNRVWKVYFKDKTMLEKIIPENSSFVPPRTSLRNNLCTAVILLLLYFSLIHFLIFIA